jgi:hypothetical protein
LDHCPAFHDCKHRHSLVVLGNRRDRRHQRARSVQPQQWTESTWVGLIDFNRKNYSRSPQLRPTTTASAPTARLIRYLRARIAQCGQSQAAGMAGGGHRVHDRCGDASGEQSLRRAHLLKALKWLKITVCIRRERISSGNTSAYGNSLALTGRLDGLPNSISLGGVTLLSHTAKARIRRCNIEN